jgi:hypothetical protein
MPYELERVEHRVEQIILISVKGSFFMEMLSSKIFRKPCEKYFDNVNESEIKVAFV